MKKERGWFQLGAGLILSLLFLMVLPACKPLIEVTVRAQCTPQAAMIEDNSLPTGSEWTCPTRKPAGQCIKINNCTCP